MPTYPDPDPDKFESFQALVAYRLGILETTTVQNWDRSPVRELGGLLNGAVIRLNRCNADEIPQAAADIAVHAFMFAANYGIDSPSLNPAIRQPAPLVDDQALAAIDASRRSVDPA